MDDVVSWGEVEGVENQFGAETVRTRFDQETVPASLAVVATLADVMDADSAELDPLYDAVDPDSLDALCGVRTGRDGAAHVTFTHEAHAITVSSYGVVTITPEDDPTAEEDGGNAAR